MDNEFSKICDWLSNSSQDHFNLHQEENVMVIMKLEVPQRLILHYPVPWSNGFCGERLKKKFSAIKVKGPWQRNVVLTFQSFMAVEREGRRKGEGKT